MILDEFSFINSIKQKYYQQSAIIKGIGDDAAVFRQEHKDIVTAVDTFVDGVHFTEQTMRPSQIGYRVLAANISDLAAMGSRPAFYIVSITVPKAIEEHVLHEIYDGMKALASSYQMDLIGGDTVSGHQLSITVTVIGFVDKGKARYRSLAKSNDVVFVTGTLGDAQAGLHILQHPGKYEDEEYFVNRHVKPEPRAKFADMLCDLKRLSLNDISDGIANEAAEIAEASNVDIVLNADQIPVSPLLSQFPSELQHEWKYFGGEDFELLGTVSQRNWNTVKLLALKVQLPITKVGKVHCATGSGQVYLEKNGQRMLLDKKGYTHLRR